MSSEPSSQDLAQFRVSSCGLCWQRAAGVAARVERRREERAQRSAQRRQLEGRHGGHCVRRGLALRSHGPRTHDTAHAVERAADRESQCAVARKTCGGLELTHRLPAALCAAQSPLHLFLFARSLLRTAPHPTASQPWVAHRTTRPTRRRSESREERTTADSDDTSKREDEREVGRRAKNSRDCARQWFAVDVACVRLARGDPLLIA